jgi:hypothetical protein
VHFKTPWVLTSVVVAVLLAATTAHAEIRLDVRRELQLIEQGLATEHIPNAAHRVAIFTYEDPDRTGLGGALAALAGRAILTGGQVRSLGVLRYEGDLAPESPGAPAYFEKVERIVSNQRVSVAVWGSVRRLSGRLLVDTYLQLPDEMIETHFTWKLPLPARMGGDELRARLRPSRIVVQRLSLPASDGEVLTAAARGLDELRPAPDAAEPIRLRLPQGQPYTLEAIEGEWIRLRLDASRVGWSRLPACPGQCASFLSAARFPGEMLRYMATRRVPMPGPELTADARAAADQVRALAAMGRSSGLSSAMTLAERWMRPSRSGARTSDAVPVAAGSTFVNIFAINRTASMLTEEYGRELERQGAAAARPPSDRLDREVWSRLTVERAAVGSVVSTLARAAARHPGDADLLHNLAVLLDYVGDRERGSVARRLADGAQR